MFGFGKKKQAPKEVELPFDYHPSPSVSATPIEKGKTVYPPNGNETSFYEPLSPWAIQLWEKLSQNLGQIPDNKHGYISLRIIGFPTEANPSHYRISMGSLLNHEFNEVKGENYLKAANQFYHAANSPPIKLRENYKLEDLVKNEIESLMQTPYGNKCYVIINNTVEVLPSEHVAI